MTMKNLQAIPFLLSACVTLLHPYVAASHTHRYKILAVFVFGDSVLNSGNNNNLSMIVRAEHLAHGLDFPSHLLSGRFSNGRLITDFLNHATLLPNVLPQLKSAAAPHLTPGSTHSFQDHVVDLLCNSFLGEGQKIRECLELLVVYRIP